MTESPDQPQIGINPGFGDTSGPEDVEVTTWDWQPTPELRFTVRTIMPPGLEPLPENHVRRILQQRWMAREVVHVDYGPVRSFYSGAPARYEWRDVPLVTEPTE